MSAARALMPLAPAIVILTAVVVACEYHHPAGPPAAETANPPSDVLFYAHVIYGGDSAYLVDGKWYKQGAAGWMVFTREPLELELLRRSLEPRSVSWFGIDDR
ncbi:MAG: hypothetical protein FWD17_01245 [Polyangiaceae bacterium]|nr:hypothetical protein [Polyangiaceae bacterium]